MSDEKSPYAGPSAKRWIQTYSGKKFFPLAPVIDDICIEDIAHHLSMLCRFTGAVKTFYSVAEHSCHVALAPDVAPADALAGLLHDAAEAYLNDMASPIKHSDELMGYRDAEARLQGMIYRRFGLPPYMPDSVRVADGRMLATEALLLMSPLHADWLPAWEKLGDPYPDIRSLGMASSDAQRLFLRLFHDHGGK